MTLSKGPSRGSESLADTSRLRTLFLRHLSKPPHNRPIYQAIAQRRVTFILELGIGSGQRALRMIEAAAAIAPVDQVRYTGVDLFEARAPSDGPYLTLKRAHSLLRATGAQVRLVPGDPFAALALAANALGPTDLVVISQGLEENSLAKAWFYLPRTLHAESVVLREFATPLGELSVREIPSEEIVRLAAAAVARRAA